MTIHLLKRDIPLVLTLLCVCAAAEAQTPRDYYSGLNGKSGASLKTAVYNAIKDAQVLEYGSGSGSTWEGFYTTDRNADNTVVDRYSNDTRSFDSKGSAVSGMNIEHSFPKSWWGGSKVQAYKDLYNLMPCEQKINSSKSNYPMGKVTNVKTTNGCTNIGTGSNGYQLWEPADKWKGDFARGYMYMATAYQNYTWQGTQALQILQNNTYPTLQQWAYTLYLEWARTDTPDELEIARNAAVAAIQGNRNPFVDFPNLMEYIWGDSTDVAFNIETTMKTISLGDGTPSEPTEEYIYDIDFTSDDGGCTSQTAYNEGSASEIWVRTSNYGWKGSAYANKTNAAAQSDLYTAAIDLTDYQTASLSFEHAVNFCSSPTPGEMLSVKILDTADNTTTALEGITWPAGTSWAFNNSGTLSLDAFVGKTVKVVFSYTSTTTTTPTWEIKNILVKGKKKGTDSIREAGETTTPAHPVAFYTTDGRLAGASHKGIVIVRMSDGTTVKYFAR